MIMSVPVGYLITTALAAIGTLLAIAPLRRPPLLAALSFRFGLVINELPFIACYYLDASNVLAISQHDVTSAGGWTALALGVLAAAGLGIVVWRGWQTSPAVHAALAEAFGDDWPRDSAATAARLRRLPLGRILFQPFFARRFGVEKLANISYGDAGQRNRLDLYRHRSRPVQAPVLIHLHGGRFVRGRKSSQAMPLLYRLASQGWVCISANYRLSPAATFPDFLIDVKKVLAWVRENGPRYGADPATVFVAGSSAGAHLAAMAALTPNDPAFQPGFEEADTSVTAAITLGGYYGPLDSDGRLPSSPMACVHPGAPPFFIAHGTNDTVTGADMARALARQLRATSASPVVYAELPGGQHAFDLFHSLRFDTLINGIEAFATSVQARAGQTRSTGPAGQPARSSQVPMLRARVGIGSEPWSRTAPWKPASENAGPRRLRASSRIRRISSLPVR
jgi:acetyl esterase/lipase